MPPVYFWLILLLLAVKNKSAPIVLNNFPRLIKRITMPGKDESEYAQSGVSSFGAKTALGRILEHLLPTWKFNPRYPVIGGKEYYASVIDIGQGQGIAFCTDGVGTKIMIAEMLDKYDTIGIDCVAMNVNDIICVGARPASLVDYIACSFTDDKIFSDLAKGLAEGARQSEISISGGEISQMREVVNGIDLIGSCIGTVSLDKVNNGSDIVPGNLIVGLGSSGIHSNGLTLARKILLGETNEQQRKRVNQYNETLRTTFGLELLTPTRIYVRQILEIMESGVDVKAVAHITGGGFCNLNRVLANNIRFVLSDLPEPQAIFQLIQEIGKIQVSEMHDVFNMGVGMCVIVENSDDADQVKAIAQKHGTPAKGIGFIEACKEKEVIIPRYNLVGRGGSFN